MQLQVLQNNYNDDVAQARNCASKYQEEAVRYYTLYNEANEDRRRQSTMLGKWKQLYDASFGSVMRKVEAAHDMFNKEIGKGITKDDDDLFAIPPCPFAGPLPWMQDMPGSSATFEHVATSGVPTAEVIEPVIKQEPSEDFDPIVDLPVSYIYVY